MWDVFMVLDTWQSRGNGFYYLFVKCFLAGETVSPNVFPCVCPMLKFCLIPRLPKVPKGYPRLWKLTISYPRLPKVGKGCQMFPKVPRHYICCSSMTLHKVLWATRCLWRLPIRSGVSQGFCQWEKLILMYRVPQKKAVKSNPGKFLRKCNFNFFNAKNWPIFASFEPFFPSISILLIFGSDRSPRRQDVVR